MAIDTSPNFVNPSYATPEELANRRAYAAQLLSNSQNQPIHHWTEGLASMAQALMGGLQMRSANADQRAMQQGAADVYSKMLSGDPSSVASTPPMGNIPVQQPKNIAPGKIYSNDEPSPLDPPSGQDRDLAVRTIVGEAGNQGPLGMQAVGNVIRNRAVNGGYGGDTPSGVVLAKNQFEPWNGGPAKAAMLALKPTDPAYIAASAALDKAYTGDDPTNGAVNFVAPKAQAALGRAMPDWAQGPGQDIGDHRFFGGVPQTGQALAFNGDPSNLPVSAPAQQPSSASAAAPPAAAPAPVASSPAGAGGPFSGMPEGYKQQLIRMLQNPQTAPMAQQIIQKSMESQLNPTYGFQTLPDGTILRTNPRTGQVEPIYSAPVKPELKEVSSDPLTGQKHFEVWDAKSQTMRPVTGPDGKPIASQNSGFLAPGLTDLDRTKTGDDYLNQFGPEVQAAVKAYINGDVLPTGNPRKDTIASKAKEIAQTYGQQMGIPVSDALYAQKRQIMTDLARSTPGSLGGQQKFAGTALEHLAEVTEKSANGLHNGTGPLPSWVPWSADLAHKVNSAANSSVDRSPDINAVQGAVQHYGQEITKFYTGSPGGEAERMRFLQTMDPKTLTPQEMAAAIRTERDLIPGRLVQNATQIQTILGPEQAQKYATLPAEHQKSIERINKSLAKLDPTGPEAKALSADQSMQQPANAAPVMDRAAIEAEMKRRKLMQ